MYEPQKKTPTSSAAAPARTAGRWVWARWGLTVVALLVSVAGGATWVEASGASARPGLSALVDEKARSPAPEVMASPAHRAEQQGTGPVTAALQIALFALLIGGLIFGAAFAVKRAREARMGQDLSAHLAVRESIWVGRGQRILVLGFENQRVLVGVSQGGMHSLGVFGDGKNSPLEAGPIEREAERRKRPSRDFSELVQRELAVVTPGPNDRRQRMLSELDAL